MYYPLYKNPFYYPYSTYNPILYTQMNNNQAFDSHTRNTNYSTFFTDTPAERNDRNIDDSQAKSENLGDLFSIKDDRLEVFGISINLDDLIILIMLFFMFRENQIDYSIIIILALILFDQS